MSMVQKEVFGEQSILLDTNRTVTAKASKDSVALKIPKDSLLDEYKDIPFNKAKEMDVRIAITQAKLEELYEDPNIPPEFGTLILMINTELEKLLRETL